MWSGLKDGARVTKQEFTLELDDVADMLDEDQEAMTKVLKVFEQSLAQPKGSKKKAIKR